MSGHSKWNNIKHKKEAGDAKRAQVFTKIGREIAIAVKDGGPDPVSNSRLRDIIAKAKTLNVPNDNINRMITKYAGQGDGASFENITYEGYGPGGIAVIVETLTDNRNRTAADMRHYFDKNGGNLGQTNSVSWQFDRKGVLVIENAGQDEDEVTMAALDAGAADINADEEIFEILTDPDELGTVREALEKQGYEFVEAEVKMIPQNTMALSDEDQVKNMNRLLEMLDDNDDVQNVWHNWEDADED
ncbi:MAG: YebC/PmpR family DNA-binding transcriptional regulator [Oscillospiraceae bacterium]|jgi:YebC/PmpR family DNA-binding regulatory protein|nr:YebC/PmpR family DNA-binding transcriptional regulator [Oscillospiraceae bacterium]